MIRPTHFIIIRKYHTSNTNFNNNPSPKNMLIICSIAIGTYFKKINDDEFNFYIINAGSGAGIIMILIDIF